MQLPYDKYSDFGPAQNSTREYPLCQGEWDLGLARFYSNDEAGAVWMRRMLNVYPKAI
jgi:hypothetical protein